MAIGDTVQAGLMRIDTSAYERAGQANAAANKSFGVALGQVAKGYFVGQEKKARANEIKDELMRQGIPEDAAGNISKNPFLQKEHARKEGAKQQMQIARMGQKNAGDALAQKAAFEETRVGEKNEAEQSATNIAKFNLDRPDLPITEETPAAFLPELDPDPFVGPPTTYQGQAPAVAQLPESFQPQGAQVVDAYQSGQLSPLEGNRIMDSIRGQAMAEQKAGPTRSEDLAERKFQRQIVNEDKKNKPMPPVDSKYEEATLTAVDDALGFLTDDTKKFFSTGVIGQALSNVAGTDATSLRSKLDTITSGVGFGRLNDMREASKTGGALGNVSEIELRQLNASMGSLNPNQKPSELKKTLETIKKHYESTVRVLKAEKYAYDNELTFKTPKEAMDFVERYNNLNASSPQQTDDTIDPSAPASQATLDVLEKKRQLRSKRAGL